MERTITKLFDDRAEALAAVNALERAGVHHDDMSMMTTNEGSWFEKHSQSANAFAGAGNRAADGATTGASTGAVVGGGAGLLAGLGLLAVPGLGPVVAAGWLASLAPDFSDPDTKIINENKMLGISVRFDFLSRQKLGYKMDTK